MAHDFRNSPFVVSTSGLKPSDTITGYSGGEPTLDHLGECSLGGLYWNNGLATMGLVCGAATKEISIIVRRLLSSHLNDEAAEVLIIHTDHFSLRSTRCSLLHPEWRPVRILLSPDADDELTRTYNSGERMASPITFNDTSISLRDVLALFTPPPGMQGSSAILGTVQLIVSQLRPPFDLQRFIELVDQEKWSEEGVNFMALRQTLLTKLLSTAGDGNLEGPPRRVTLVDLTDPILQSTGLDSSIVAMAMQDFIRSTSGRRMIVLNNCQQYLYPASSLTKTLESLAIQGNDRSATILLSTSDPNNLSSFILHSLDYVIFGSSRSLPWGDFLHKHFTKQAIPKAQSRVGRAMIWSPSSSLHALETSKDDLKARKVWDELLSFIDIEQFEQSMPSTPVPSILSNVTLVDGGRLNGPREEEREIGSQSTTQETTSHHVNQVEDDEEEEGIISLDKLDLVKPFTGTTDSPPSSLGSSGAANEKAKTPPKQAPNEPAEIKKPNPAKNAYPPSKFLPLTSAISHLSAGQIGILVPFEAVRKQLGSRENVKKLGWTTFTKFVKAACDSEVVELIETDPDSKFLALLPTSPKSTASDALSQDVNVIYRDKPQFWASDPALPTATDSGDLPIRESNASPANKAHANSPSSALKVYPEQYATLFSAIIRISGGSTGVKVSLGAVRNEIGDTGIARELLTYGWATFGQWVRCACMEKYAEQGGVGSNIWIMLNAVDYAAMQNDTPSAELARSSGALLLEEIQNKQNNSISESAPQPLHDESYQTQPQTAFYTPVHHLEAPLASGPNTPSNLTMVNASDYPFQHRPVVSTILKLTGGVLGGKVRLVDFTAALQLDFPRAREDFLFSRVFNAETDGILRREKDHVNVLWLALQTPASFRSSRPPTNQPHQPLATPPSQPPLEAPIPSPPPPVSPPTPAGPPVSSIPSNPLNAVDFPLKHRAVVSIVIKLTNGVRGSRVRMADLTTALRGEYQGAKEGFLFSLVVKAEEEGVLERETDMAGLVWACLRAASARDISDLNPKGYPAAYRAVASVIQGLVGADIGREVPINLVHGELRRKRYADTMQAAVDLTTSATAAHVMRLQRDENGERYALLEDPKLSRGSADPKPISERGPVPPELNQLASGYTSPKLEGYPLIHRPLVSAIFVLTNGQCYVPVKMETIIRALMMDPSAKYRDAGIVTSLVFEAADAKVVKCGKDDLGVWWTSVEEPVRPVPQTPNATTQNSTGQQPQPSSSLPAASNQLNPDVFRTSAFSPLIDVLNALKSDTFGGIPYASTVATRVLTLMPNVLQQAGCSTMPQYFDLAAARGVIWIVGSGDKRMIRLRNS